MTLIRRFTCADLLFSRRWVLQLVLWSMVSAQPQSHPPNRGTSCTVFSSCFIYFAAYSRITHPLKPCPHNGFSPPPPSLFSLCGANEGILRRAGPVGGPSAHFAGIWHMWTVHHKPQDIRVSWEFITLCLQMITFMSHISIMSCWI